MKKFLAIAVTVFFIASTPVVSAQPMAKDKWFKGKTSWGYLSAKQVKSPKSGQCVSVPTVLDIRNVAFMPAPISVIGVLDDFGNFIAYEEIMKSDMTNGKTVRQLRVCSTAHTWTHPSGNRGVQLQPFKKGESYSLTLGDWLSGSVVDQLGYKFAK
jgi:hypothetical protein